MSNQKSRGNVLHFMELMGTTLSYVGMVLAIVAFCGRKDMTFEGYISLCVPLLAGLVCKTSVYSQKKVGQSLYVFFKNGNHKKAEEGTDNYVIRNRVILALALFAVQILLFPILKGGSEYVDFASINQVYAGDGIKGGQKIIAYNQDTKSYSTEFVHLDLLARSKEEVGAILQYKMNYEEKSAYYGQGKFYTEDSMEFTFKCEQVTFTLVDRCTGKVIDTDHYSTSPPQQASGSSTLRLSREKVSERVKGWINKVW